MKTTKADRNVWRRIAERRPERPIAFVTEDALHLLDDADRAERLEALLRELRHDYCLGIEVAARIDKELADGVE